jgi:hypothetical protein
MKHTTRGLLLVFVAFTAPVLYGGKPSPGVAGVAIIVKQIPGKHAVTNAQGNFDLGSLPKGSYTFTVKAQKAKDTKNKPADKVTIAESYSVKIEGGKRSIVQNGLTSNQLIDGLDVPVQVSSGANIRGQVAAGALKKMIWYPQEPGSHVPGHWVEEGSAEAKRAFKSNAYGMSAEGQRRLMDSAGDVHQEGFGGKPVPPGGH